MQRLEAVNGDVADLDVAEARLPTDWSWFGWNPHDAGYLASLIQFTGTLLKGLGWIQEDFLIWTPDMVGLHLFPCCQLPGSREGFPWGGRSFEPRQVSCWGVILNLIGPVSAFYAFSPSPPESDWAWSANLWTFVGAVCFFVAGDPMIPEQFDADAATPSKALPTAVRG